MASGGCLCGKVRIQYNGQPLASALCHCRDCRKLTGSLCTYNFIVKSADLEVTGSPKEAVKTSDSGNRIKNYFCSDCGTPLYSLKINPDDGTPVDGTIVLRAGILDDTAILNQHAPKAELYAGGRISWINPAEGAGQFPGMPPFP